MLWSCKLKLVDQVDYSGERPGLTKLDLEGVSLCRYSAQCTITPAESLEGKLGNAASYAFMP